VNVTAPSVLRESLSVILDAAGALLLVWLGVKLMFGDIQTFEPMALFTGAVGTIACLLAPNVRKTLPVALIAYVAIALLSSAAHQWPAVRSAPDAGWFELFQPAAHLVTMLVFVFGASFLLRLPWRLSLCVLFLVGSAMVLGVQVLFDRVSANFFIIRAGSVSIPSVAQWSGLHQVGLIFVLTFPMVFAATLVRVRSVAFAGSAVLAVALLAVAFFNQSRSGLIVMVLTAIAMVALKFWRRVSSVRVRVALGIVGVCLAAGFVVFIALRTAALRPSASRTGERGPIWQAAANVFLDHPWFGVGPGNYTRAMVEGGYAARYIPGYPEVATGLEQAHNVFLQVAAETGVFGLIAFTAFVFWMIRACWRAWKDSGHPLIAGGILFALLAFVLRSLADNFLDLGITADRIRVLVWILFGAALATSLSNPLFWNRLQAPTAADYKRPRKMVFAAVCAAVMLLEWRVLFVDRNETFAIEGNEIYPISEFASGRPVSHAFLMRGDGLQSIRVLLNSDSYAHARIRWTLWRGSPDVPPQAVAASDETEIYVVPGRQWTTLELIRDGSSNNRWYTLELQLVEARPAAVRTATVAHPRVEVIASRDNPDRGGVLWLETARQTGSLVMRADRRGKTLYGRFQSEAAPHLTSIFRFEAVQWLIVAVCHAAFAIFAYAVVRDSESAIGEHA
jgi:O-antigen ligase